MTNIAIAVEPIELYKLLKLESLVASGGEAKHVIAEGFVRVNGNVETRKRKKIYAGDIVEFGDSSFTVCVRNK
jgi:ribosome-associated protein